MDHDDASDFVLISGAQAYADQHLTLVQSARKEIILLSQALDRPVYATEAFIDALRAFVLQHQNTRIRLLVVHPQKAMARSTRLIEFCRAFTNFVEVRELAPERRTVVREEYAIADGRVLLQRDSTDALEARYAGERPLPAHLKRKDFEALWADAAPSQELRAVRI